MTKERKDLYDRIASTIGNTPLYEIKNIYVPNGNKIFCKEEYLNPTGSHYDRFWIEYMRTLEERKDIFIGMEKTLLESTTGNSGASFAWVCSALGYTTPKPEIVIPADMPRARIKQIEDYGAKVLFSPSGEYVRGLILEFRRIFNENKQHYYLPNHCVDTEVSLKVMESLVDEVINDLNGIKIDCFVSALGNGLTTRGIGSAFKNLYSDIQIIGVEPRENPTVYVRIKNDIDFNNTVEQTHGLLGTAPGNLDFFSFRNMDSFSEQIDNVVLVSEDEWKAIDKELRLKEGKFVGHTSAACLKAALDYATTVTNKNIFIVFYDPAWKYMN